IARGASVDSTLATARVRIESTGAIVTLLSNECAITAIPSQVGALSPCAQSHAIIHADESPPAE
ncbi:MAG: hypothetical protein ACXVCO_19960, partial [Ktedonobacterales bacterium]